MLICLAMYILPQKSSQNSRSHSEKSMLLKSSILFSEWDYTNYIKLIKLFTIIHAVSESILKLFFFHIPGNVRFHHIFLGSIVQRKIVGLHCFRRILVPSVSTILPSFFSSSKWQFAQTNHKIFKISVWFVADRELRNSIREHHKLIKIAKIGFTSRSNVQETQI